MHLKIIISLFVFIKALMLGIIMKIKISARLTPQLSKSSITTWKKVSLKKGKKKERKYKQIWGTRPKPIYKEIYEKRYLGNL